MIVWVDKTNKAINIWSQALSETICAPTESRLNVSKIGIIISQMCVWWHNVENPTNEEIDTTHIIEIRLCDDMLNDLASSILKTSMHKKHLGIMDPIESMMGEILIFTHKGQHIQNKWADTVRYSNTNRIRFTRNYKELFHFYVYAKYETWLTGCHRFLLGRQGVLNGEKYFNNEGQSSRWN